MKRYDFGIDGIEGKIGGGTNILLIGPPLSGKDVLAKRFFYQAAKEDGASIYVSTTDSAKNLIEWFEKKDLDLSENPGSFGIIDCVTKSQDLEKPEDESCVKYASSPVDLTDIGVKISNFLKEFYMEGDKEKVRLIVDTVSVMIMYSNVKTIFRFLHTFSGRMKSIDGVGLYVLEEGSHEEKTIKTLKQLMDASLRTEDTENGKQIKYDGKQFKFDWKNYQVEDDNIILENSD
ncbi:recombinase RecA [archaeon SCG-AAA382B04]|nr:recombinase RecA [archaeon SCG-AAA382B04]